MKVLPGIRLGLGSSVRGVEILRNSDHLEGWEMLGNMFGGSILLLVYVRVVMMWVLILLCGLILPRLMQNRM